MGVRRPLLSRPASVIQRLAGCAGVEPGGAAPYVPVAFLENRSAARNGFSSAFFRFCLDISRISADLGPEKIRASQGSQCTRFMGTIAQYRSGHCQPDNGNNLYHSHFADHPATGHAGAGDGYPSCSAAERRAEGVCKYYHLRQLFVCMFRSDWLYARADFKTRFQKLRMLSFLFSTERFVSMPSRRRTA